MAMVVVQRTPDGDIPQYPEEDQEDTSEMEPTATNHASMESDFFDQGRSNFDPLV